MRIEKYIQMRCAEDGIEFDINKINRLKDIIDRFDPQIKEHLNNVHLVFAIYEKEFHHPSGNSAFKHLILLNGEWAYIMTHNDYNYTQDELLSYMEVTIGHEIGHKMLGKSILSLRYGLTRNNYYFIAKLHEIFCDFYAYNFISSDNPKQAILDSCDFKLKHRNNNDDPNKIHPHWKTRKKYIEDYTAFTEQLIRNYAEKCGITNKRLINDVVGHYRKFFSEKWQS